MLFWYLQFNFFQELDIYKFYNELSKSCNGNENNNFCNTVSFSVVDDPVVITLLKKLFRNLNYLLKYQDFFVDKITKAEEKHCIHLKYWLYDQIVINNFDEFEINIIFDFLEKHIHNGMLDKSSKTPCNFHRLNVGDIDDIKNMYSYSELFYETETKNYEKILNDYKYLNYFKNGFDLYRKSKIKCSTKENSGYCEEFKEYKNIYEKYGKQSTFLPCQEWLLSALYNKDETLSTKPLQKGI